MALRGGLHAPGEGLQDMCLPAAEKALRAVGQAVDRHQGGPAPGEWPQRTASGPHVDLHVCACVSVRAGMSASVPLGLPCAQRLKGWFF